MKPLSTDEIRQSYLDFFESKGHACIPGASLVPENDPTVLFTTAGMHPLVPYLMGEKHPSGNRLVDVQKCVRTGDIDEVGDASHLTMFEMLGNWSLGDYFKKEAIAWSYEFLTEVLQIPKDMLAVTCFQGDNDAPRDDEAAGFWKSMGIPEERIGFLPKAKNWWGPAGQTGPCGPDTEMFYWVGEGSPLGNPATHDAQWLEIWNDVFMQYNKNADGTFTPLKQQNVDTGMGLERVAKVLQGVETVYETDRFKPIVDLVVSLTDHSTQLPARHVRIIVDHLKAATFVIADGVKPSNVDQGYVLRRIIRRAIRSARQIGIPFEGGFTPLIAGEVIAQYGHIYGNLKTNAKDIRDVLSHEEQQFLKTLQEGMKQFQKITGTLKSNTIAGQDAFHLYDTYGFPIELTKEIAAEHGFAVDEKGFAKSFEAHQDLSRKGAEQKFKGGLADHSAETTKLHTATHLLNAALHTVLGQHISQKGSNITAERLRFDFNHPDKMTPEQISEVERLVNEAIAADLPVSYHVTTVDGAKKEGAIGVFGERYGSEVKVYVMGDFSREICGGPHVSRTGVLGSFKIQKEESSSAGVRRIKAIVSGGPAEVEVAGEDLLSSDGV
ncbi:alanine--tRNA ligase [Candidatus Peregrinibacteria bacterium]|nr:alanine--tRNA ligase [Candidatus Peregrinibacteria bacterium]